MDNTTLFEALEDAILDGAADEAAETARQILAAGGYLLPAVDAATAVIRRVGDRFGEGEIFLPELVQSAEAMHAFMEVLTPELEKAEGGGRRRGKAVVSTVKGDIHSIGKNIVATMLKAAGYEVIDLGVNVPPMDVIDTAERAGASVIGLSALMTTSMPYQQEVIALLNELGARDRFFVVVGGGPVTSAYAESVGADGWAADAGGAVRLIDRMLASGANPAGGQFFSEEK